MPDSHSPESDSSNTSAHDPSQPWPGIGRVVIPIPESLRAEPDDGPVVMDDDDEFEDLACTLQDAENARLHLSALLEVLRKCHPAYKIEAGLYVGNLQPVLDRLQRIHLALDLRVYAGQR